MKEDQQKFYIFDDGVSHRTVIIATTEQEARELTKSIYGEEPHLVEVAAIKEPFICTEDYYVKDFDEVTMKIRNATPDTREDL